MAARPALTTLFSWSDGERASIGSMRRLLLGSVIACGIAYAVACGDPIDTTVLPGDGDGAATTLPDGATTLVDGNARPPDPRDSNTGCETSSFSDAFLLDDAGAWDAETNGWGRGGDFTNRQTDSGSRSLYFVGTSSPDSKYVSRPVQGFCEQLSIVFAFQYDIDTPLTMLEVASVGGKFSLGYAIDGHFEGRRTTTGGESTPVARNTGQGTGPSARNRHLVRIDLARDGAVRLEIDQEGEATLAGSSAIDLSFNSFRIGLIDGPGRDTVLEISDLQIDAR